MSKTIKTFFSKDYILAIVLFVIAISMRTIPEIKAGIWPIGYDTFNTYAAELASYHGPLLNWFKTANILYFLFLPFKALGLAPDLIVKIFGPLLYGALAISFYFFVRKFIKFSPLLSFLTCLLFILQLATLRLSWDLYRNELGLIFLFLALIQLSKLKNLKNLIYFLIFSILVVLSHQLVSVLLCLVLLVYLTANIIKRNFQIAWRLGFVLIIDTILFFMVIQSSGQVLYDPNVIFTSEKHYFWRYFYKYDEVMPYGYLASLVWYLFYLCYGLLLPLIILGVWQLRKNIVLTTITIWLLAGTFSSLIFAGQGLMVWERWLFMLVFPFTIYAVAGILAIGKKIQSLKLKIFKIKKINYTLTAVFWLALFSFLSWQIYPFLTADYKDAKPPLANDELNSYFPRTMVHNSVGLWEISNVLDVADWLNKNAPSGSLIIVDNRYRGPMLTRFDIDDRYILTNPWSERLQESTFELARKLNYQPVYLIWNITKAIDGFDRVYNFGNRGIYKALPEFYED